jgi:hypothetical protein
MTPDEVVKVLARIQADDNRDIGKVTVASWSQLIGDLDFQDAIDAVILHRRESTDWLMPAHVIRNVARIRARREREQRVAAARLGLTKAPVITLDRAAHEADTQKWIEYYRKHPEAK